MHTADARPAIAEQPTAIVCADRPQSGRRGLASDLLTLARPGQWPKNVLVVPLVMVDTRVWTIAAVLRLIWAVAVFTACSSATYVVNDIYDKQADRGHPVKRTRPVAALRITLPVAWLYAASLGSVAAVLISIFPLTKSWPILGYVALSLAYSRRLKHIPLVEVFVVATGFLLRLGEGYLITGARLPSWLPICVLSLCLLFVLGKRRHELTGTGARHRPALSGYSVQLIDLLILLASVLSITTYLLFLRQEAPLGGYARLDTLLCAPFAMFGVFRYLQLVIVQSSGEDPVRILLRDRPMVANSLALAAILAAALLTSHFPALAQSILHKVV